LQAVIAIESWRTLALSAMVAAFSELRAVEGREVAIEADGETQPGISTAAKTRRVGGPEDPETSRLEYSASLKGGGQSMYIPRRTVFRPVVQTPDCLRL